MMVETCLCQTLILFKIFAIHTTCLIFSNICFTFQNICLIFHNIFCLQYICSIFQHIYPRYENICLIFQNICWQWCPINALSWWWHHWCGDLPLLNVNLIQNICNTHLLDIFKYLFDISKYLYNIQLLEYLIPLCARARHKNRHMAISREPRVVS